MPSSEKRALIERVATLCGGSHSKFNQSWSDIKQQRQMQGFYNDKSQNLHDATYVGGMCHPMSLYWLALREKGEKSLFEWLKPGGVWDKGAINVLVVKTAMYKNNKNNFVSSATHKDFDDQFFKHYGLNRYGAPLEGMSNVLSYIDRKTAGYHMISLSGPTSGHAVAAHVQPGGESAFFDPNYGEYSFPNPQFLGSFMKGFMKHSGYEAKYTVRQKIETFR
ncbi:MAG: YopT-type cysteine protease domain-containing protein [Ketobacter sp.]|nr:YopT-type cysteine protease domain-containing protein [Ketobacter sp.]